MPFCTVIYIYVDWRIQQQLVNISPLKESFKFCSFPLILNSYQILMDRKQKALFAIELLPGLESYALNKARNRSGSTGARPESPEAYFDLNAIQSILIKIYLKICVQIDPICFRNSGSGQIKPDLFRTLQSAN